MRDFDLWLKQFRDTIATYDYYVDFEMVVRNAQKFKPELHLLNALIGSQNIKNDFRDLLARFPQVIKAVPILIAKRESEIYAKDAEGGGTYTFKYFNGNLSQSIDEYCVFMKKTGLFDIISRHLVNNLYDYVMGVEAGLSSNGRKNRGGDNMENLVEGFLRQANVTYFKEVRSDEFFTRWSVDLSPLTNSGETLKRFDFVVKTENCVYGIETNFYTGGGSKLNETARSYKMLALEAANISGFKFVWFTDGAGWRTAKRNLKETFNVLPDIYNIKELEDGIINRIFI